MCLFPVYIVYLDWMQLVLNLLSLWQLIYPMLSYIIGSTQKVLLSTPLFVSCMNG